jgi:hypothetical protein
MVEDFDIAGNGGVKTALQKIYIVSCIDGSLTIRLINNVPRINEAKISGIEIYAAGQGVPVPVPAPVRALTRSPTRVPVKAPTQAPFKMPMAAPVTAPKASPASPTIPAAIFKNVYINCGGDEYSECTVQSDRHVSESCSWSHFSVLNFYVQSYTQSTPPTESGWRTTISRAVKLSRSLLSKSWR